MSGLSSKKLIILFLDICILISLFLTMYILPESYDFMLIYATSIYIVLFASWLTIKKDVLGYFFIFLILTYLYGFGQYFLNFFDMPIYSQYTINNVYTPLEINETAIYYLINIVLLHFSVVIFDEYIGFHRKKNDIQVNSIINLNKIETTYEKSFNFVVLVVLAISFVCETLVLMSKIKITLTQGYAASLAFEYGTQGFVAHIISFISTLFLPALFAALITTKGKKSNIAVWLCYIVFLGMYFLSGSRFEAVISLAGVVILYHNYYQKINIKKLLIVAIVGVVVLYLAALINSIRIISAYGDAPDSFIKILELSINNTSKAGVIETVISTTGFQILANVAVYQNCPSEIDYSYGMYYLGGIARVIPNFLGGENPLITMGIDGMFTKYLTKTYGMGSSFIIEAYYNFGVFGTLMMVPFGAGIAYLGNTIECIKKHKNVNVILKFFVFYIVSTTLFYPRSDARMIVREIVFYYLGFVVATWVAKVLYNSNFRRRS